MLLGWRDILCLLSERETQIVLELGDGAVEGDILHVGHVDVNEGLDEAADERSLVIRYDLLVKVF